MKFFLELFGLIGLVFKAIIQFNSPERRKERVRRKLEAQRTELEMEAGYALRIKDMDRLAVANFKLNKLREQANLLSR